MNGRRHDPKIATDQHHHRAVDARERAQELRMTRMGEPCGLKHSLVDRVRHHAGRRAPSRQRNGSFDAFDDSRRRIRVRPPQGERDRLAQLHHGERLLELTDRLVGIGDGRDRNA